MVRRSECARRARQLTEAASEGRCGSGCGMPSRQLAKEAFKLVLARPLHRVLARGANAAPVLARSLILELIHEMPRGSRLY